jgi:rhomboid protease GluP
MNEYYYAMWDPVWLITQICLFQFLHGGIIHLLANSYFLYTAWPELEARMSRDRYTWFFVSSTIFVAIALIIFAPQSLTIGISGFAMALLSYLWIDLYTTRHPMAMQILMMLAINIGIGLVPGISLVGHLSGAIWWMVWWGIARNWKR